MSFLIYGYIAVNTLLQVTTPTLPSPFDSAELVAGKGEGFEGGEKRKFLYNGLIKESVLKKEGYG